MWSSFAAALLAAHPFPWINDQTRFPNRRVRQRYGPKVRVRQDDGIRPGRPHLPSKRPAAVPRVVKLDLQRRAYEPRVVLRTEELPLDPRRTDLQHVPPLDQVLGFQVAAELLIPISAVLEGHAGLSIDEDPNHRRARLGGEFQVPEIERFLLKEGLETPGKLLP